jgi:hypothetical protein
MKFDIGIIGSGSAAACCALSIFNIINHYKEHYNKSEPLNIKISVISNPNIPKISVGESLSPTLFMNVLSSLSLQKIQQLEEMEILLRIGARHTWENNQNSMFDVNYNNMSYSAAAHVSSEKFSDFVFKTIKKLFNNLLEIHDNVKFISQNDNNAIVHGESNSYIFDYVFDCRGFPTKEEFNSGKYNFPKFQTVNSVLLFRHEKEYTHPYSEVIFHKNGWQFGINTRNRKAFGYLYNKDITDKEEALKHFKKLNKNLPIDNVKELYWPSYSVKKAVDGRVICMGNKLYFYEPIQGIPLHMYYNFSLYIMFGILNISNPHIINVIQPFTDLNLPFEEKYNKLHTNFCKRFYEITLTNYSGNILDSEFWRKINYESRQYLLKSTEWINFCHQYVDYKNGTRGYPDFFPHPGTILKQYFEGLNVNPEKFINGEYLAPK